MTSSPLTLSAAMRPSSIDHGLAESAEHHRLDQAFAVAKIEMIASDGLNPGAHTASITECESNER